MKTFRLRLLAEEYAVCRLPAESGWPEWAKGEVVSVTHTPQELSVVCSAALIPPEVTHQADWRCLHVDAVMDFSLIGVIAGLTRLLAAARVSVFVCSTYDTDYILVPASRLTAAIAALRGGGHQVVTDEPE